ncbi:DUF6086 family protein [Streptomyces bobili]|uniref:DUF6086 family protein n=1 Tax=Streptomyces bobili TaxID=67280 RepID=UPI0036F7F86E
MSQYYEVGGETVWNPSTGVSQVFLGYVRVHEERLRMPSGFGPMRNDECEIDPAAFEAYLQALVDWYDRTSHSVLAALTEGFIATLLAVAHRTGIEVRPPEGHGWAARALALSVELHGSMAR